MQPIAGSISAHACAGPAGTATNPKLLTAADKARTAILLRKGSSRVRLPVEESFAIDDLLPCLEKGKGAARRRPL
jgi:hypothetical protein